MPRCWQNGEETPDDRVLWVPAVKFWDTSALVPLILREKSSARCQRLLRRDPVVLVSVLTQVELQSALARRRRLGEIDAKELQEARRRVGKAMVGWNQIQVGERLLGRAIRLLDLHDLRAADALQLAAGWVASGDEPSRLAFVSLDERLLAAAEREGFPVIAP